MRCSRCKEVWLARPEDAIEIPAPVPAMAETSQQDVEQDAAAEWEALAREDGVAVAPGETSLEDVFIHMLSVKEAPP